MAERKDFLWHLQEHINSWILFCASQIFLLNKDVRGANKVHQLYWVREKQRPHIYGEYQINMSLYSLLKEKANSFKCVPYLLESKLNLLLSFNY